MIATTGSSGTERDAELVRPDHLSVWLDGGYSAGAPPVSDDGRLVDGFTIPDWVDDIRLGYPSSVLAATFRGGREVAGGADGTEVRQVGEDPEIPAPWSDAVQRAAALSDRTAADLGDASSFRGDTTPTSLRELRRWVAGRLSQRPEICDDAVLTVSELATNVERHAPSWLTIDIIKLESGVMVAVTDPVVDHLPQPRSVPAAQASGRGLLVVATLSIVWGVVVRPSTKTVWSALALDGG